MCGITLYLIFKENKKYILNNINSSPSSYYKEHLLKSSSLIKHRGPDWSGNEIICKDDKSIYIAHERLAIIDPLKGSQPLIYEDSKPYQKIVLCVNGEIYNYKELKKMCNNYNYKTNSDCEVIIALYLKYLKGEFKSINEIVNKLDGQFSFILYDNLNDNLFIARDPIGITSLYYGFDKHNNLMVCSELKGLYLCNYVYQFPSGSYCFLTKEIYNDILKHRNIEFINYYNQSTLGTWNNSNLSNTILKQGNISNELFEEYIYTTIRTLFTKAVEKRLMSDVPFGVLLSGGLDSSLVSSITVKLINEGKIDLKWGKQIHSFSIGIDNNSGNSPDLIKAQKTANFLGTIHHNFTFTIQEGIDALRDVIYHLETYDITTIRASTPMFLLARKIKAMGVKMVLSGEGADEMLGGYLYFLSAPNDELFFEETKKRMQQLDYFDCLRANKSTLAWGLEGRFPFLDKEFISYCLKIPPSLKRKNNIEKYVLRKAFDIKDKSGTPIYLPDDILWRQKEQFSDGVGYSWIDSTRILGEQTVTEQEFDLRLQKYPINTPDTKEAYMFRKIYEDLFPNRENCVKKWIPRTDWSGVSDDPSGRAQKIHQQSY